MGSIIGKARQNYNLLLLNLKTQPNIFSQQKVR